jgi:CheY-like chemotaxis protein
LESEGYNVDAAHNGCEAVDKLSHDGVDILLLDVMMPIMDGLSVCKMIKRDPRLKDMPVIIMSASETLRESGRGCADAILAKPFDLDRLVETVGSFAPAT